MPESNGEIDKLCRELYQEHRDAWRAIRRRLPSERDESHAYLGRRVAEHLKEEYGGDWDFVVRRDRYACVFRPMWSSLGSYDVHDLVRVSDPIGDSHEYPRLHFRLAADRAETDSGDRFDYQLRLKVDTRKDSDLGVALVSALKRAPELKPNIPERRQFTLPLKSSSKLPGIGADAEAVPDSVVDWFAKNTAHLVPVLDSVFKGHVAPSKKAKR